VSAKTWAAWSRVSHRGQAGRRAALALAQGCATALLGGIFSAWNHVRIRKGTLESQEACDALRSRIYGRGQRAVVALTGHRSKALLTVLVSVWCSACSDGRSQRKLYERGVGFMALARAARIRARVVCEGIFNLVARGQCEACREKSPVLAREKILAGVHPIRRRRVVSALGHGAKSAQRTGAGF